MSRVLADDNDGSRHQRILVRLPGGQTVLIVHNIDIAPRIAGLAPGSYGLTFRKPGLSVGRLEAVPGVHESIVTNPHYVEGDVHLSCGRPCRITPRVGATGAEQRKAAVEQVESGNRLTLSGEPVVWSAGARSSA